MDRVPTTGERSCQKQAARRPAPERAQPAAVRMLALQRSAGNAATAAMIARYHAGVTDYRFGGGGGEAEQEGTAFVSQAADFGQGTYTRTTTGMDSGNLTATTERYDPSAKSWQHESSTVNADRPAVNVSQSGKFAIEAGAQAKVVYVEDGEVDAINGTLEAKEAPVRLGRTGQELTFASGVAGRPAAFTLGQASVVPASQGSDVEVDEFADLHNEQLSLAMECHDLAEAMSDVDGAKTSAADPTAGTDAAAQPGAGQALHYKNRGPADAAVPVPGQVHLNQRSGLSLMFKGRRRTLDDVLAELQAFDQRLDQISARYSMLDAVKDTAGGGGAPLSPEAAQLTPGWQDHSEAVVAVDGPDQLTFVNYNRETEARWLLSRVAREAYRTSEGFRKEFKILYAAVAKVLGDSKDSYEGAMDPFAALFKGKGAEMKAAIDRYASPEDAARAQQMQAAYRDLGPKLWYFAIYGPAAQSFHSTFQALGGRGLTQGQTTVVGTPAPAVASTGAASG